MYARHWPNREIFIIHFFLIRGVIITKQNRGNLKSKYLERKNNNVQLQKSPDY
jgi:hypothetical protein